MHFGQHRLYLVMLVAAGLGAGAGALSARGQERPMDLPWMSPGPQPEPVFPEIFVTTAEALGTDAVPLDARSEEAYRAAHLPGALRPDVDAGCIAQGVLCIRARLARLGLDGKEPVLVYGDDLTAEGRLFWLLGWAGFSDVRVLDGDLAAWRAGGGEVESGEAPAPRSTVADLFVAATEAGVDRAWVRERFGTPAAEVLDLRGRDAWQGPGGQIPHSLPFDFHTLLPEDGGPPDPPAAREKLSLLGPRRGDYVDLGATFVVYGEGPADDRTGLGYLLLRALGVSAAVYPGGWSDWSAAPESPIVRIVDAQEVARRIGEEDPGLAEDRPVPGLAIFDVRGEGAYAVGHLPGAVSLPAEHCAERLPGAVPQAPGGGDRFATPIVFYCYGIGCIRSRNCSTAAARAGFRDILWLRDGMPGWQAAGLPAFHSAPPETSR